MKINHQDLLDGFCKYFEKKRQKKQKKYGFEDKYLESIKKHFETIENKTPSSFSFNKRRD